MAVLSQGRHTMFIQPMPPFSRCNGLRSDSIWSMTILYRYFTNVFNVQAGVAEQLMAMLESSSAEVRAVAAACLGDLAAAHPPLQPYLTQV